MKWTVLGLCSTIIFSSMCIAQIGKPRLIGSGGSAKACIGGTNPTNSCTSSSDCTGGGICLPTGGPLIQVVSDPTCGGTTISSDTCPDGGPFPAAITVGNELVICEAWDDNFHTGYSVSSFTDTLGNTLSIAANTVQVADHSPTDSCIVAGICYLEVGVTCGYGIVTNGGANDKLAANYTGGGTTFPAHRSYAYYEITPRSGIDTSATQGATGSSSTPGVGSVTTAVNGEFGVSIANSTQNSSPPSISMTIGGSWQTFATSPVNPPLASQAPSPYNDGEASYGTSYMVQVTAGSVNGQYSASQSGLWAGAMIWMKP